MNYLLDAEWGTLKERRFSLGYFDGDMELRKNGEGYSDPTAYQAIKNADKEDEQHKKLMHVIFYVCNLAGFKIESRIVLRHKKSGKVWK